MHVHESENVFELMSDGKAFDLVLKSEHEEFRPWYTACATPHSYDQIEVFSSSYRDCPTLHIPKECFKLCTCEGEGACNDIIAYVPQLYIDTLRGENIRLAKKLDADPMIKHDCQGGFIRGERVYSNISKGGFIM